ncbi:MAG: acyl carrier protein [bacterium]
MTDNNIESTIRTIFCEVFGVSESEVRDDTAYDSFEAWDSLRHLEFVARFEDEFDIDIEIDDVIAMETFKKVKDTVKKYISQKAVAA